MGGAYEDLVDRCRSAEYAGVSRDTIYTACERGELHHARIGGRRSIRAEGAVDRRVARATRTRSGVWANSDRPLDGGRCTLNVQRNNQGGCDEEVRMGKFGLTKRCDVHGARGRMVPDSWHYKFKWRGRRFRGALDDVLHRHVAGKTEAFKEVKKIYDAVRDGTFGRESAEAQTLRQLGERYFKKYVSPKTGHPLG